MRKIFVLLIALFLIPVYAKAATSTLPNVTKVDATNDKLVIKYNGETEDGSLAVMCKLFNSKDEELDMLSSPVSENKFDGTFTVTEYSKYKIMCANYEGGDFKSTEIELKEELKTDTKEVENKKEETNPKTGDNILFYVILSSLCIISLCIMLYLKRKKN